jgi:KDO2-lipid IV(A) lauroyltransferase
MDPKTGVVAWLQYAAVRVAAFIFLMFPVDLNLATARFLGRLWWHLKRKHRDRARDHLRAAMGNSLSPRQLDRIALRSLQQLVMLAVETIATPRLITGTTWAKYVRTTDFSDALRVLLDGRGALLVTGHYGNWELTGHLLAIYGFEVVAIMRPFDNVYLNRYLVATRRAAGLDLLDKKGAMRSAEQILRRGGALGFIADQDAGRKGMFVDFFGRQASTYKSIGLLAMTADVPIIVGYARRIGDRLQYELAVERIIRPQEWRDRDDPLRWITQEYTAAIERFVRRDPAQYLWLHRRWKSRPKHERQAAPATAAVPA